MDAATATDNAISKAKGRKDGMGQEAVIKMAPVKENIDNLIELFTKAGEASEKLNDAIKATAEKSGLLAGVVRKFVTARAGEKFEEEKRKVEQLSLIFDEVGDE